MGSSSWGDLLIHRLQQSIKLSAPKNPCFVTRLGAFPYLNSVLSENCIIIQTKILQMPDVRTMLQAL